MFMLIIWTKILLIYIGSVCFVLFIQWYRILIKKIEILVLFLKILKDLETYNTKNN